ncbi:type IX secretion system protein PorD [Flavihumibacter profundi]|jgi:hypothetical protein|uniref:type IX secretion system protein PorD n=1 Tax=Flavihumibacter profundi TaxID=2716883 RepID=UPI001CC367B5|nr:DUF4835 family protein [Flavihumibacter profundi]MBZ5857270.1 DUF4835 family protein [Flavihumibacter profundi]
MLKRLLFFALLVAYLLPVRAQEFQAKVVVMANQVNTKVDRKVFNTLQSALNTFINNRKWSRDTYQPNEKILCNFLINVSEAADGNIYRAKLTVQAARPVYNTAYMSPLVNYIDENLLFRYVEFQQIEFNENRVTGNDPLVSNLPAVLAFYVNIILGMDGDSFSLKGGDPYFVKAQNIVNNSPESRDILGWKAFDGQRNRYWLMENLTSSKYTLVHDAFYGYFRLGLDQFYEKEPDARKAVITALQQLNTVNGETPNSMILPFFFQGRTAELSRMFKKSPPEEKSVALDLLTRLDISNANTYKQEMQ